VPSNLLELYLEQIAELIKQNPNDNDLGKLVRYLYDTEEFLQQFKK
jgi:hypothetical protein